MRHPCPTALLLLFVGGLPAPSDAALATAESSASRFCLQRVAGLPKAEGYNQLCGSVDALYREQHDLRESFVAVQEENKQLHSEVQKLRREQALLQAESDKLRSTANALAH